MNSRDKGKRGELEIVHYFAGYGFDVKRGIQTRGAEAADVVGLPGIHLEAKRRERIEIEKWCHQAEAEAGGLIPVVVWRRSRQPWRVTQLLDDWMPLYLAGGLDPLVTVGTG